MTQKLARMSNAPINKWPKPLLTAQVALILDYLLNLNFMEAIEIANEYEEKEAIALIEDNLDLIGDKNGNEK